MRNGTQPADFSVLYTVVTISYSTWGYATRFILQGKICVCEYFYVFQLHHLENYGVFGDIILIGGTKKTRLNLLHKEIIE